MGLTAGLKEMVFRGGGRVLRAPPLGSRLVGLADGAGKPRFQILVYHRVLPQYDPFAISMVTSDLFQRQMRILRACFRPLSLDQLLEELDGNRLKPGAVAVTFDDGYRDNLDHALPILKRFGIPATVYLATGLIGTGALSWYDGVLERVRSARRETLDFEPAGLRGADLSRPESRREAAHRVLEWLKGFAPAERDARIRELGRALGHDGDGAPRLMLDWDEARRMHREGVTLGSHTVNHPILSRLSEAEAEAEIGGSKAALEGALQAPVRHFAYPNGRREDYDETTLKVIRRLGFKTAVTTRPGVNGTAQDRHQWLRRQPWESSADSLYFRMLAERLAGPAPA